jgi:hypothetical protein
METTPVAQAVFTYFNDRGYKEVKAEDCDVLAQKYVLEKTLDLYIVENGLIKHINSIGVGKKLVNGETKYYVHFNLNDIMGDAKEVDKSRSACTIFQAIAAPDVSKDAFRGELTLWQKRSLFGNKVALVYTRPSGRTVSGHPYVLDSSSSSEDRLMDPNEPNTKIESKANTTFLGPAFASVLVLSVLGLSLAFYLKHRNKRRAEEEELSRPD